MSPSIRLRLTVAGLLPALAACGGDARAAGPVVRDSAGVRIVENGAPAWKDGEEWRLAAEPALDIGMVDGPPQYQFGAVAGVVRLGDGTVVVGDDQSKDLRFFDRAGRHLRTVGRKGGGPGEFEMVGSLVAVGDSLLVGDWSNRRVTVFAPDGSVVRLVPLDAAGSSTFTFPVGYFRGGGVLLRTGIMFTSASKAGLSRDSVTFLRLDPGGLPAQVGRFPGGESFTEKQGSGSITVTSRAFGRAEQVAVVPDGFFYGSSDSYEIGRYDTAGRLRRLVRRAQPVRPVTPADVERYKEVRRRDIDASYRQAQERSFAAMPFPETMPAHGDIQADRAGNLWVSDYMVTPDDPARWTVFDPEGRMLGAVTTPARFRVHEIGDDYVLGVWKDEMDVEHVRLYSLEKPGAGS